jgi:monoamine oxidase
MRSPLIQLLRKALRTAATSESPALLLHHRRKFLRTASMAAAAAAAPSFVTACRRPADIPRSASPRIVILGAGIAGLHAAHVLRKSGIIADVYEASTRLGGRIYTGHGAIIPDAHVEIGGEYIDSNHADMLGLAREFGLELMDLESGDYAMRSTTLWFNGRRVTEDDIVRALQPFLPRLRSDVALLPSSMTNLRHSAAAGFDRLSLDAYLTTIGMHGWIRNFFETAFVTEHGLELGEQSALNALAMISTDVSSGEFRPFGDSDERFKIVGGNDQIPMRLATAIRERVHTGYALERIAMQGQQYILSFRKDYASIDIPADIVLCTIPFSVLRTLRIDVELPERKRRTIDTLRYGNNSKVMIAVDQPFWRAEGLNGLVYSDAPFQLAWDHTAFQQSVQGGLTFFSGGAQCRALGTQPLETVVTTLYASLAEAWPMAAHHPVLARERFHWPGYRLSRGSYSSYGPGQWTDCYGSEFAPVGNLYFAGEHCSTQFKGYMNGAAETGRRAAEMIAAAVGAWKPSDRHERRNP